LTKRICWATIWAIFLQQLWFSSVLQILNERSFYQLKENRSFGSEKDLKKVWQSDTAKNWEFTGWHGTRENNFGRVRHVWHVWHVYLSRVDLYIHCEELLDTDQEAFVCMYVYRVKIIEWKIGRNDTVYQEGILRTHLVNFWYSH
jgi:hypothetical protein